MSSKNVREIIRLIVLEASERKGLDLVGRIATINVEVMLEMMEILRAIRESEKDEKTDLKTLKGK